MYALKITTIEFLTLYLHSSKFQLFFSSRAKQRRNLNGKFHKSCVCLCALRGDFSPPFLLWRCCWLPCHKSFIALDDPYIIQQT